MSHGGARPGAGRKPGSATQRTRDIADAISEGLTPLEFLTNIYRDVSEDMARRIDAAKAAAPYVHPKLANIDLSAKDGTLAEAAAYAWQPAQPKPR